MMYNNPLTNKEFLLKLFAEQHREIFVRVTALTFDETPIEYIEGKAIDGTINIDGTSAVRRTCNLTLIANDINIHDFYWGIKHKFKLEIGLANNIDNFYPDIIWFKQGLFVITQFSTSQQLNKWTIKIQGKDKMCLLNGDVSGNLPFNVDFANEEYYDVNTKQTTFTKVPIKTIIVKALTEFGNELSHNILINNIDEAGQELLTYRGTEPLYLLKDLESGEYRQMIIDQNYPCYYELKRVLTENEYNAIPEHIGFKACYIQQGNEYIFDQDMAERNYTTEYLARLDPTMNWFKGCISDSFSITYEDLLDDSKFVGNEAPSEVRFNLKDEFQHKRYSIVKVELGDTPGYRLSSLVYGDELKASIGESITSVLDKIKNKFVSFEYFYNVDGKFVFQQKKEYLNTKWSVNDEDNQTLYLNSIDNDIARFNLASNAIISAISNNPKITELKNDFSVWGSRENLSVHMRYAIDKKPVQYQPIRKLKEKHIVMVWDINTQEIIRESFTEKYYDAPEIEPYNDDGLFGSTIGYDVLKMLPRGEHGIHNVAYNTIKSYITQLDDAVTWLNLFYRREGNLDYFYSGDFQTTKRLFEALNETFTFYDTKIDYEFIPLGNNLEEWHIICPYFAAYPYSTEDVYDENNRLVHYKVDWRELIYQMALDYRKLNYVDNYAFHLQDVNPWCMEGRTGYEQYYIDLEGFWRLLYNPNPEPVFTDEISYSQIKQLTTLIDEDNTNDTLDLFYIKNAYQNLNIQSINYDSIKMDELYCWSAPKDRTNQKAIYPFIGSEECALTYSSSQPQTYYIEKENAENVMEELIVASKSDASYSTLNSVPLNKISIKKDQTEYVLYAEEQYQSVKNSLDDGLFYTRVADYYKLSDLKQDQHLWSVYYRTDLDPLSWHSVSTYAALNKLITDKDNEVYINKCVHFAESISSTLKNYIGQIINKPFAEIHIIFYNYIRSLIVNYKAALENLLNTASTNRWIESVRLVYKEHINNIEIPNVVSTSLTMQNFNQLFNCIQEINIEVESYINGIKNNISQVNALTSKRDDLNKTTNLFEDTAKSYLRTIYVTLKNTVPLYGENSQVITTYNSIDELYNNILNNAITEEDARVHLNSIFEDIDNCSQGATNTEEIVFNIFSTNSAMQNIIDLISHLKTIFEINENNFNSKVFFNNNKLLNINSSDDIGTFKLQTSNFQEYLIRQNTNNFNEIKDDSLIQDKVQYYKAFYPYKSNAVEGNFWAFDVFENPESLIFWFDFLDPEKSELSKYSVPAIGSRIKVVNDKEVKTVHWKEIPNIMFSTDKNVAEFSGYSHIHLTNNFSGLFETSQKGKTAKERTDELLYNHTYCQENVNLSLVPMYNFQPSDRIYIKDYESDINGEYVINKITIPLNYKKLMSVTANKIISDII